MSAEDAWFYCADCSQMYLGGLGHECPDGSSSETFAERTVIALLVIALLLLAAGVIRWSPLR